jgi:hypothetical protein
MKNFVCTIPQKGLEEKQRRESKEIIILKYQYYIGSAKKNHRSGRHDKLFRCISEESGNENKTTRKNKETYRNYPKNWRGDLKRHKTIKGRQNRNHTCKKYRIPLICIVHPQPESKEQEERKGDNNSIIHIPPEKTPEKVDKCRPGKSKYTIGKMPQKNGDMWTNISFFNNRWEKYIQAREHKK